jgi:hypothetical protein
MRRRRRCAQPVEAFSASGVAQLIRLDDGAGLARMAEDRGYATVGELRMAARPLRETHGGDWSRVTEPRRYGDPNGVGDLYRTVPLPERPRIAEEDE